MANFIPGFLTPFLNLDPSSGVNEAVSYISKAMRLAILASRLRHENSPIPYGHKAHIQGNDDQDMLGGNNQNLKLIPTDPPVPALRKPIDTTKIVKEGITIVDIDYGDMVANPFDDTNKSYQALTLPFVPNDLSIDPASDWVAIATMARNNPHYHYTGSEDTLEFEIDWFTSDDLRRDVIANCRWVESLSKSDGYKGNPHRVMVMWGNSDELFRDSIWVVVKAPYKLSQFNRGFMYTGMGENGKNRVLDSVKRDDAKFMNTRMLPQQAMQTVTLKKITQHNMSRGEVLGYTNTSFKEYKW